MVLARVCERSGNSLETILEIIENLESAERHAVTVSSRDQNLIAF